MCKKAQYSNFGKALKAMQRLNKQPGWDLKRAYICPDCGKWHLTSQELKH